ncbi:hypothetical protein HAX54_019473, partial [Datura stramonium]|nr:hypothetical protein [Datura stramonium]
DNSQSIKEVIGKVHEDIQKQQEETIKRWVEAAFGRHQDKGSETKKKSTKIEYEQQDVLELKEDNMRRGEELMVESNNEKEETRKKEKQHIQRDNMQGEKYIENEDDSVNNV